MEGRGLAGRAGSLAARVRYGLGPVTPFTEAARADAFSRTLRAGLRVGRYGDAVDFELAGGRSDRADGAPEYRFDLRGRLRIP